MKGIILAGGTGSRLYPATYAICKQLLPIYDKPMIYYPLSLLMLAGITEILIISTKEDTPRFEKILGGGSQFGLDISYAIQPKPEGLAQAFLIGEDFIGKSTVSLILGDNIFYGHDLPQILQGCSEMQDGAIVFGYHVQDPGRYGVIGFDERGDPQSIEEKPKDPRSSYAVTGLYFYDNDVISIAKSLKPSPRGELEISDINQSYLKRSQLKVRLLGRGYAWLDTGTFDAYYKASAYVQTIQERQGIQIACLEEIAYRMGFIDLDQLSELTDQSPNNVYGNYLRHFYEQEKLVQKFSKDLVCK